MGNEKNNKFISECISEFIKLYNEWSKEGESHEFFMQYYSHGSKGKPSGVYWGDAPYIEKPMDFNFDLLCKAKWPVATWMHYDKFNEYLRFITRRYYNYSLKAPFVFPEKEKRININTLKKYCENYGFGCKIIDIENELKECGAVFIIEGSLKMFDKAGWRVEFKKKKQERQREHIELCNATRLKIRKLSTLIDKIYNSKVLDEIIEFKNKQSDKYSNLSVNKKGLFYINPHDADDVARCYDFMSHGYEIIETDDELLAFTFAYVCRINSMFPSEIDLDKVEWPCEFYKNGFISLPIYPPSQPLIPKKEKSVKPLWQ